MDKVQAAKPVTLSVGEVLFVRSLLRSLNKNDGVRNAAAVGANMTLDNFSAESYALAEKIEVMAFPINENHEEK